MLTFTSREEVMAVLAAIDTTTIRKVVTRLHRLAPSLEGHSTAVIEARLKEEEDEILKQLHTLGERLEAWQRADG